MEALKKSLIAREEEGGFEVEEQNGVLNILFEDPPGSCDSPNTPPRQVWISALSTSFKLDWSETAKSFVLPKDRRNAGPGVDRVDPGTSAIKTGMRKTLSVAIITRNEEPTSTAHWEARGLGG